MGAAYSNLGRTKVLYATSLVGAKAKFLRRKPKVLVALDEISEICWPQSMFSAIVIHQIYINCWFPLYRWSVMDKTGNQYPPKTWKWGGSGYLYLHYWPPVDREPAINVDMVNTKIFRGPNVFQSLLMQSVVMNDLFVWVMPSHSHRVTFGNIELHLPIGLPKPKTVKIFLQNEKCQSCIILHLTY